jgi:Flp pilus assembly pilin Flp
MALSRVRKLLARRDLRGGADDVRRGMTFRFQQVAAMDMNALQAKLRRLASSDTGQDLVEYALLASLIAMVAFAAVSEVGNTINTVFWSAIASANV